MNKETFNFGKALEHLKEGKIVTRSGWYGSEACPVVMLQTPDKNSKMTEPYLYMVKSEKGVAYSKRFPLDLSCESILAEDWILTSQGARIE